MRTLTDVFAPRTPLLPEGLRTLQVSPGRVVEPGQTVHASFTFRNLGGGTASGFRVRFRLPEGLTYLVGTASIDGTPIDESGGLTTLLQSAGADIGDIPPGGERRIGLSYSVASTIENGTPIAIQAAISSFEVPVIGSNIVRLVVRSRPVLKNASTKLTAEAVRETGPGGELQLKAQVHNSGESSAHDVIVLLPVPANTSYVAESARVDGRSPAGLSETDPFGFSRPAVVVPVLGPGATIGVAYRVRIDPVLEDATPIVVNGAICSQEVPEFPLPPVTLKVASAPAFGGEETAFHAECDDEVVPGQRVRLTLRVRNTGTAHARLVRLKLDLPDGLAYTAGSRTIDGAPTIDRGEDPGLFTIGDLEPGRSVDVGLAAVVASPQPNGHELRLGASVEWSKGQRRFDRTVVVRSAPLFPAAFNDLVRESPRRLAPGDAAVFRIHLVNLGTDVATDVRLSVDADRGLEKLRFSEGDRELQVADDGSIFLDTLHPNAPHTLQIAARVASTFEDQAQLRLRATLRTAQSDAIELGSATHVISSRPRFTAATSGIALENDDVLRPNRTAACRLTVSNEGTDRGRDVRVRLQLPEELRLESVDGASRDGQFVVFGDVPPNETREAVLHLRLVATVSPGDTLEVTTRLDGLNVPPFSLEPLKLATHAEASFAADAALTSQPSETIDAGAEITYTLALRNSGDGVAKRLTARIETPHKTVYAPGSTTVNNVPLLDNGGTSPLLAPGGLTLADVGPGVEVLVRIRFIVNTPLAAGTVVDAHAFVSWDDAPELAVDAAALRVRSGPALPIMEAGLPFSVVDAAAGIFQQPSAGSARQLPPSSQDGLLQLPPATPVRNGNGAHAAIEEGIIDNTPRDAATTTLELTPERLAWTVEFLQKAPSTGLLAHLMVLRALFPDGAADADAVLRARLRRHSELLSEQVDGLFVKLRLPGAMLQPEDLETRAMRSSLRALLDSLGRERSLEPAETEGLRVLGTVRYEELNAALGALEREPLETATPWLALSLMMGTRLERDGKQLADFTVYRDLLQPTLAGLGRLSPAEFCAALLEPADEALDDAREALIETLAAEATALTWM
ncbi:MAG TPA: hypothetical protein VE591_12460 [Candidatus Acidoferrum sp.]|nr:hypothetical protein [Candidatus Acidoferrum sp.]